MLNRLPLYALAARNQVGRAFGASAAYSPKQRWTARAMWGVYRTRYDALTAAACLGCCDGETSFLVLARGDHGEACGAYQWHRPRRDLILAHAGIDVWAAPAGDQARAFMAEISESWSAYRHVEATMTAAPTLEAKMRVLVSRFEQSGSQDRDVARRTPMAEFWLGQFKKAAA